MKKPCRKCLLAEMDFDEYTQSLLDYIKSVPSDKRADEKLYRKRLEICRSCDELANGICAKCGCFVELRALKPNSYCASEKKLW